MSLAAAQPDTQRDPGQPIGLCLDCNYALWGLPTPRCPECGREFDPLDPKSMNMGRALSPLAQWLLGPIRWPVSLLTWGAILYSLWTARLPGGQFADSRSISILAVIGLTWLLWPVLRVAAARRYGWPTSLLLRGQRQRVLIGLSIAASIVAILYRVPETAALKISQPAMDRLARECLAGESPYMDDRWVGVYLAKRIQKTGGGMRFTVEEHDRAYKSGFDYSPNRDPRRTRRTLRNLGNGWWAWRQEG